MNHSYRQIHTGCTQALWKLEFQGLAKKRKYDVVRKTKQNILVIKLECLRRLMEI